MNLIDGVKLIKEGKIIAFPTETSYGLACDPFNEKAVQELHQLKKEPFDKPVLLIVDSMQMIEEIAVLNEKARLLIETFMPGPLTIIAKKKKTLPDFLSKKTIAFRISENEIARELSRKFGKPITATSANLHRKEPAFNPEEIRNYFGNIPIIDAGKLEKQEPSTIYDITTNKIIREGKITKNRINKVLEKLKEF